MPLDPTITERCFISNEEELSDLLDRLEKGHIQGHWNDQGAVVFHIDEQLRWMKNPQQFLREIVPSAEADAKEGAASKQYFQVSLQTVKQFPASEVFHLGSHVRICPSDMRKAFLQEAAKPENYEEENCWTRLLKDGTDEESATKIMNHLSFVALPSVVKSVLEDGGKEVSIQGCLDAGERKRKEYEEKLKLPPDVAVNQYLSTMVLPSSCTDLVCLANTDSEDSDSEITAIPALFKIRNKQSRKVLYGSSVTYKEACKQDIRSHVRVTSSFSLSFFMNILYTLDHQFPGLHTSFLYFGNEMALFPIHVEDALLWSVNYLHLGAAKIWVVIPPHATEALDYWLSRSGIYLCHTSCRNILGHKVAVPSILWLRAHGIPYNVIVQRTGDMVVVLPNVAHYGFNCGWNVAEAINFATISWLPIGANQRQCTCYQNQIHLPIRNLLASFRPDLLRPFLNNELIEPPYHERSRKLLYSLQASKPQVSDSHYPQDQRKIKRGPSTSGEVETERVKMQKETKVLYKCVVPGCPWGLITDQ